MNKLDVPLSDGAVRTALGADVRILKYSELKNYGSMAELLPKINNFFICLLEEDVNRGHWVAAMRLEDGFFISIRMGSNLIGTCLLSRDA
jgi:hypothetical protein